MAEEGEVERGTIVEDEVALHEQHGNGALAGEEHPWVVELLVAEDVLVGESESSGTESVGCTCEEGWGSEGGKCFRRDRDGRNVVLLIVIIEKVHICNS